VSGADFYLGSPEPGWLARAGVPLFVSRVRFLRRPARPVAIARWALDSGGFSEVSQHGRWRTEPAEYADFVLEVAERCGSLDFAAPMDWMCEPFIVAGTGLTVEEHQSRTVANFSDLRGRLGALVIPVLQGYTLSEYRTCARMYAAAGHDLTAERRVGLGSICRRSGSDEANFIVRSLADDGYALHGFGLKGGSFRRCRSVLASADSMSWSARGRRLRICGTHRTEANCLRYALEHRAELLEPAPQTGYTLALAA
jgi:hypothetical protein